ncbi:flagellar biosynthesis protein FliQ [Phosphitispora fastidiosa]|jgi:flagellar biosynthetic protein FliQ|uniref:flagellar biosynthesis protein FliQ n=1 Tax=Phosphitispora fastidiosa TaxID=2837202 RepID=UPI001E3FBE40|nr:flagellar biosynthesis protein FliQ [Phosphitispora fastidiosa]MBU7008281.1 flagellar biosynthetic protein FliQ [Phosphitispora fastidiosa]
MSADNIVYLAREALFTVLLVASPILGSSLIIGILISFFQATTHLQEQTLTFVPKIIAVLAVVVFFGSWMLNVMLAYMSNVFINLNNFIVIK